MPSYLNFDATKKFRDEILSKNLKVQNGPQTFTSTSYDVSKLNIYSNNDLGDVTNDRDKNLSEIQSSNTYKPIEYFVEENLNVFARRANLNLYPYFQTNQDHTLVGILSSSNFDNESELFKFAANNIKNSSDGLIQSRITQNLYKSTLGKIRLLDAINGNTSTLSNIITGKEPLVEMDYTITTNSGIIGNAFDFIETITGVQTPWSIIHGDYLTNPSNSIDNKSTILDSIGQLLGINKMNSYIKPSELFLEYMGNGQKTLLFENLSYSKYGPNYDDYNNTALVINGQYIGDDKINDVKYATIDSNDRKIRSSYYLTLLFDELQAKVFHRDRNVGEGGGIAGNLTWISGKNRNQIGLYNNEFNSEATKYNETLSTNYQFRTDSILDVTQQLIDSTPSDSTRFSHVGNVIDQTSRMFKDGDVSISRGSAVKYVDKFSQEESGIEYCRVWTKDRSYMNYSDTMKRTGLIRLYDTSVLTTPWNLNIAPMSNGNKSFDGSSNMESYDDGFRVKKYMFSIENLAWKTSNRPEFTYNDLPYCERGPNGGRVMWFPPYGMKISEQNGVDWGENTFIGRPEPVFTYQKTKRTANLSFKIIVDHPSIMNLLVNDYFKNMSDDESDNYIHAFFAGCEELDFYDLIKRYRSLDKSDLKIIKAYLNNGKDTETIKKYRSKIVPQTDYAPATNSTSNVTFSKTLYFNNDIPGGNPGLVTDAKFSTIFDTYVGGKQSYINSLNDGLNKLTGGTWNTNSSHDYMILTSTSGITSRPTDDKLSNMVKRINDGIETLFTNANKEYTDYKTNLSTLKENIKNNKVNKVKINISSSASAVATDLYNLRLSYRRSYSIIKDILTELLNDGTIDNALSKVKWVENGKNTDGSPNITLMGSPLSISFKDLGYKTDGVILFSTLNVGENLSGVNFNKDLLTSEIGATVNCNNTSLPKTSVNLKKTIPDAFKCRQSTVDVKYNITETTDEKLPTKKVVIEEYEEKKSPAPSVDVLKKIIMKILSECYYFKKLEEDSPLQFSSLKEKLKYFHPAFHSMTPEGLNSRLTFLHQCIRPGDTIPIKGISVQNDLNSRNTTFGPPPIVVFRFGDFFHTKAVIRDYNIEYDENTWDLNPEGIGVQPMIATVTLQLSLIGGQGMKTPVDELQNALSSNFYANTEVYDYRSTATEDRTKFNKIVLEDILSNYNSGVTTDNISQINTDSTQKGTYIGIYNSSNNTIRYNQLIIDLYNKINEYTTQYNSFVLDKSVNTYGRKILSLIMSEKYRTNNVFNIVGSLNSMDVKLLGNYQNTDISTITLILNNQLLGMLETADISTILGLKLKTNDKPFFNNIIKPYIKTKIEETLDSISLCGIKNVEQKRNEIIVLMDKLNYLMEFNFDGYVKNNDDVYGNELTNFDNSTLFGYYSKILDFTNQFNQKILNFVDDSININSLTNDDFIDLIKIILFIDKTNGVNNILNLFKKSSYGYFKLDNFIDGLTNTLNSINVNVYTDTTQITKGLSDVIATIPLVDSSINNSSSLSYTIGDTHTLTDDETDKLKKINQLKNSIKTNTLNYYRP